MSNNRAIEDYEQKLLRFQLSYSFLNVTIFSILLGQNKIIRSYTGSNKSIVYFKSSIKSSILACTSVCYSSTHDCK